jgi:hypothetical protein
METWRVLLASANDRELLRRTRAGWRDAFGAPYERRHELALAFPIKRTRNPETPMDLLAETFAAVHLRRR